MMKKFFTRFLAALALLAFMTPSLAGWGQTASYSLTPDQSSTGSTATSYIQTLTEFTYNSVSWKMNQWNPKTLQIKCNQASAANEFRFYNTSAIPGRITQVVIKFSALTLNSTTNTGFMFKGGTTEVSGTSNGTAGTWNDDAKTITWTPAATDDFTFFAFYQNGKVASGSNYLAETDAIVVTYELPLTYTINAQSNNTDYGTVSLSGKVITASPVTGYRVSTTDPYTVSSGTATVAQDGNYFTVTPSSNCTVTINFEAIPTYTATFSVNGATSSQSFAEGASISFPANPADIEGKTFVGWVTEEIEGTTGTAPTFINTATATMGTGDVTYFAVFAAATEGEPVETKSQTLEYDTWTYYGSNTSSQNGYRLFGNGSYIVSVAFDLSKLSKVIVYGGTYGGVGYNSLTIGDGTNIWKSVTVTGSSQTGINTYTEGTALSGTKPLRITSTCGNGSSQGLRISKVEIFTLEASVVYSDYCTTIETASTHHIDLQAYHPDHQNAYLAQIPSCNDGAWFYATLVYDFTVNSLDDFQFQYYDEDGDETDKPDWIKNTTEVVEPFTWITSQYGVTDNILYVSAAVNTGLERKTYFKVWVYDPDGKKAYSDIVTVIQPAAPQNLTVTLGTYVDAIYVFNADDQSEPLIANGEGGTVQVLGGTSIVVSPDVAEGFVLQTLTVGGEDVTSEIDETGAYTFAMPGQAVTITATAKAAPGDYVRITSLDQLTDGCKVIIAARYNNDDSDKYYAMKATSLSSGKAEGEQFTSAMSGTKEILPANIAENEDGYYWTVSVDNNTYTFTNSEGKTISYGSSANFNFTGNSTQWTVEEYTANSSAMVSGYVGFKIVNDNTTDRAFALNETYKFGPYSTSNMTGTDAYKYNFSIDFFVQGEVELGSFPLSINGYTDDNAKDGYYLIASPVTVNPKDVEGLTDGTFDLYCFDESQEDAEWRNYEATNGHFKLVPGKGYLYAKKIAGATNTYNFTLTGLQYEGDGVVELSYTEGKKWAGWNLIGNPYATNATIPDSRDYYVLNVSGSELIAGEDYVIGAKEGIFVKASAAGESVTFTQAAKGNSVQSSNLVLNLSNSNGIIDRAIVRFDECQGLEKFQLNPNHTKVFFTQGNKDYAVVSSANEGEMPVNFKAETRGTYTLNVNAGNVDVTYLHLIDNLTGMDVDLLANPSYSFEANKGDNANRFRLVFKTNTDVEENTATETFAYFNGSEWVINNPSTGSGSATLQVIDMMGRVLRSEQINGNTAVNINETAGIYMLRLINGENVMVQKVVVR